MLKHLIRKSRLRRFNPERRKKRFEKNFGRKLLWIWSLPCCVCGKRGVQAAHAKSRAAGGTSAHLVPLCVEHHSEQHHVGILTFEKRYDVDLLAIAVDLEEKWGGMSHA